MIGQPVSRGVQILPVHGIPEVVSGDDIAAHVLDGLKASGIELLDGDVLVVTHKIVSKAEGRIAPAATDEEYRRLAIDEAASVIRRRGDLIIAITRHGFICANAGVDRSNVPDGNAVLLPIDADRSAHRIRRRINHTTGRNIAVIVSDTFGRPWRRGVTDVAIGLSGMTAVEDLKGTSDAVGRTLDVTEIALVDEIAAAADLAMGKATSIPVAVVRGVVFTKGEGRATDLVRPPAEDMFR